MKEEYSHYMQQCLELAKRALTAGDPPVGAVIVFDNKIIGKGIEAGKTTGDVTNHAEILAVRDAIENGYRDKLNVSTMYTTHEPCIMCSYVIRHHRIPKIVYGAAVPDVGGATSRFDILTSKDIAKWGNGPEIISGICLADCIRLNDEFIKKSAKF